MLPVRSTLFLALVAAGMPLGAADIDAQLAPADAFKITSQNGTLVRLRVNDDGSVTIPALPSALQEDQFLCFDNSSGQLGRCPQPAAKPTAPEILARDFDRQMEGVSHDDSKPSPWDGQQVRFDAPPPRTSPTPSPDLKRPRD